MAEYTSSTDKPTREDSIGKFLLRRLREVGLAHVFGVTRSKRMAAT